MLTVEELLSGVRIHFKRLYVKYKYKENYYMYVADSMGFSMLVLKTENYYLRINEEKAEIYLEFCALSEDEKPMMDRKWFDLKTITYFYNKTDKSEIKSGPYIDLNKIEEMIRSLDLQLQYWRKIVEENDVIITKTLGKKYYNKNIKKLIEIENIQKEKMMEPFK